MTTIMSTNDAIEKFLDLINRVAQNKERIVLTRRGKEIAAIVPMEDLHAIQSSHDKQDLQEAIEALKEARQSNPITLEELKEKIG